MTQNVAMLVTIAGLLIALAALLHSAGVIR